MPRQHTRARRTAALLLGATLTALTPAGAAGAPAPASPGNPISEQPAALEQVDAGEAPVDPGHHPGSEPWAFAPDGVLISEVASGGPGNVSTGSENFIELTNYSTVAQDISGWYIWRCGQSGGRYGPQVIVPDGTVLEPGAQYTAVRAGSNLAGQDFADATYDTSLHSFGFGAYLATPDHQVVDRVGRYHDVIHSECGVGAEDGEGMPETLDDQVSWAHGESIQRVARSGDLDADWIVGERTPGAPNTTEPSDILADRSEVGDILISEFAPGGPGGYNEDFIELVNAGEEAVDVSGWKVWRCGANTETYAQSNGLPAGSVIEPGETYLLARSGSSIAGDADVTYGTSMHWVHSGAMVLTPDNQIVDRFSMYQHHRISPCTDGDAKAMDINVIFGESYQRVADTGNNAEDFVAAIHTPFEVLPESDLEFVEIGESSAGQDVWITEIAAAGPSGSAENYIELTNMGTTAVDTSGWQIWRCEGTGRSATSPQIADMGLVLEPGQTYLAAHQSGPASLVERADALYAVGLNQSTGYGAVIYDAAGDRVDGVAVFDTQDFNERPLDHCGTGLPLRNNTRNDEGISYQRVLFEGDSSYHEFVKADAAPGTYVEHEWHDDATPLPGQTDPVDVERHYVPGTPAVEADGAELSAAVRTEHEGGADLDVAFHRAAPLTLESAEVFTGTTDELPPATREIADEQPAELTTEVAGAVGAYPFQRFEVSLGDLDSDAAEVLWQGQAGLRSELQFYGWDSAAQEWLLLDAAAPSADGDVSLLGELSGGMLDGSQASVLVVDGPRTTGGVVDEVDVTDQAFVQPGRYDFAINHMTDTQFLSEGFVSVLTDMTSWVVANHDARDIAYSFNSGDIVENWMRGFAEEEWARREFRDASTAIGLLNEHGVPNGVLPGNHDNFWGRSNDLYNEYFGPEMFQDQPWWGNSWRGGDNSAHYDWFIAEDGTKFIKLHLQYRPSDAQIEWANQVAQSNPDWNIMLATHSYLYTDNSVEDRDCDNCHHTHARGQAIWDDLIAPNDNIFMVTGGHYHGVATNYADPITGERVNVIELPGGTLAHEGVGESGRLVVEMLANYQGYRSTQPEPRDDFHDRDTGFQRLLQFDLDAELMAVNTYSPTLDEFEAWKYDEPAFRGENARYGPDDDEFVVAISLIRPKAFTASGLSAHGQAGEVGAVTVAAGEVAQHTFTEADRGQLWYARVTAGEEIVTTGALPIGGVEEPEPPVDPEPPVFSDVPEGYEFGAEIAWLAEQGITTGWADGTFRPRNSITREAMAVFLHRYSGSPEVDLPASSPFVDVSPSEGFYDEVVWLSQNGIATGYSDGTFRLRADISREAMAAFMYRYAGSPEVELPEESPFADVDPSEGFYTEIVWLYQEGIASGWETPAPSGVSAQDYDPRPTFRPRAPIQRQAMAAFLYRYDQLSD